MAARNLLLAAPPYPVGHALTTLGSNLRTARLRRNLSLQEVAAKIGAGRHVIADAEKGKPSTSIAIYVGLMWAYGLTGQLADIADPEKDEEGLLLARRDGRINASGSSRAFRAGAPDNDF